MFIYIALLLLDTVLAHPTKNLNNSSTCLAPYSEVADYQAFPDQNAANSSTLFPMALCRGHQIEEASIDQIQSYLTQGTLTSQQLAFCYMQRIWQIDDYLNAVLEINPDSMQIASARDQERMSGHVRGPLHGIPFMIKDNIATKDKMQTTAGSWALQGSIVPRDAHVVHKLREAGAVLLGKATLSEWASMRSNNYSEGYSARGGQCRSAYNLTVNPGGSSSGSAVGVAANVFTFALGTETDGSVINPAERNAIVGIKPTVGLTSRAGVVPESLSQDTVGVFAKSVRDATYVLDVIYGPDERDNQTLSQIDRTPTKGYTQFLSDRTSLQNATFGIPWQSFWRFATTEQQEVLTSMIDLIEKAGARIFNGTEIMDYERIVSPNGWNWDYGRLVILSLQRFLTGNRHYSRLPQRERIHLHQSRLLSRSQELPRRTKQYKHEITRRHCSLQLLERRQRRRQPLASRQPSILLRPRRLTRKSRNKRHTRRNIFPSPQLLPNQHSRTRHRSRTVIRTQRHKTRRPPRSS